MEIDCKKTYFYSTSLPSEPGSIVKPGNWGRMLRLYTRQTSPDSWWLARELIYEQVRQDRFPDKPCRFESIFLCPSEQDIIDFKNNNRPFDLPYEVKIIDETPSHIGDLTLPSIQPTDNYAVFVGRAMLYWKGENIVKPEIVAISRIRIKRSL